MDLKHRIADMVDEQIVYKTDCAPDAEERFAPEVEFEQQRISPLIILLRAKGPSGGPRYFQIRISEVM